MFRQIHNGDRTQAHNYHMLGSGLNVEVYKFGKFSKILFIV